MFGSLVLIFPTHHKGGDLIFRHGKKEWVVESSRALLNQPSTSVVYAAFFSDVEHEVTPVTSGHRVTLTFNLYYADMRREDSSMSAQRQYIPKPATNELGFCVQVRGLLDNAAFLPEGGALGFALSHMYPYSGSVSHVPKLLKGSDRILWRIFSELELQPEISLVYYTDYDNTHILLDDPFPNGIYVEDIDELVENAQGTVIRSTGTGKRRGGGITWVTFPGSNYTEDEHPYITYGNEAEIEYAYGHMVLVVQVGRFGERRSPTLAASSTRSSGKR